MLRLDAIGALWRGGATAICYSVKERGLDAFHQCKFRMSTAHFNHLLLIHVAR